MSNNLIITIGRQSGSGGKEIGQKLAKKLGINCYDKELLALAAKDSGLCEELFENNDEKLFIFSGHGFLFIWLFFFRIYGYADQS